MQNVIRYRFQIILIFAIALGFIVVQSLLTDYSNSRKKEYSDRLVRVHSDAVLRAQAGIDVYAALISSIRSYIKNTSEFPSDLEIQSFLNDLIADLNFNDSIVVNFLEPDHTFKYVISPTQLDAPKLIGRNAADFRPKTEIDKLTQLMTSDEISLFEPINLREGWAGLPFNFSAKNNSGEVIGYVAPVLNVKYLLDYFYSSNSKDEFIHSFVINDSIDLTREAVHDGTPIFNPSRDSLYYKNFNVPEDKFIFSNLSVFNINLKVGSAYKQAPKIDRSIPLITYIWYALLSLFSFLALIQYVRNRELNRGLRKANSEIEIQNNKLKDNLLKIQTLIKEIHHRVKNNMQMIASLLTMEEDQYDDPKIIAALEQSKSRIQSMSLVHEKLYGSQSLQDINTHEYIQQLIDFVEGTIGNETINPQKHISIPDGLIFDADTMASLGLIINELITNSYKYAYKSDKENHLYITIEQHSDHFNLIYADNGPGLPDDFDLENSRSLGVQLIYILTDQLNGKVTYTKGERSTFNINFKEAEAVH
ncbi:MAG: sensor histidine kinase [Flavobacteriaceae bacterium]|nr:sensor histidine kinase [Flavobacteriaceae bacterium]